MNDELRKLNAVIAYLDYPKKKLARFCRVSPSLFSMYLKGDRTMPGEIKDHLKDRLNRELQAVQSEQAGQLEAAAQ